MTRDEFEARHGATWDRIEELLERLEERRRFEHELAELPALYRRCCHHLALVRQRHYGASLEARLNRIARRGYHQLYRRRRASLDAVLRFLGRGFPRVVRAHAGYFWLATVLFYGPGIAMGIFVLTEPSTVYTFLPAEQLVEFEAMYADAPTEDRGSSIDFAMFGYYVYNNVSIAFRTFAAGLFAGVGTLFFLIWNGLFFGAIFAHLTHAGVADNLLTFVVTHGAFELTALVISGVAGLRLGAAIVAPGRRTRAEALRHAAPDCVRLVLGTAFFLFVAAFLEAFWSSAAWIGPTGKLAVGSAAWIGVGLYLAYAGRSGGRSAARSGDTAREAT